LRDEEASLSTSDEALVHEFQNGTTQKCVKFIDFKMISILFNQSFSNEGTPQGILSAVIT
jgi:hypothetical protein